MYKILIIKYRGVWYAIGNNLEYNIPRVNACGSKSGVPGSIPIAILWTAPCQGMLNLGFENPDVG